MRQRFKKITVVILLLSIIFVFSSCNGIVSKEPQFKENAEGMALYRYKSKSTETVYTVPDEYEGKTVTELMNFSLANADYLNKIVIGKNISKIGVWAMTNCGNLEAIEVSPENEYFTSVDGVLYNKDMTEILCYPNSKSSLEWNDDGTYKCGGEFIFPETVKSVRDNAFYCCHNLYKVVINEGVESIGDMAFIKCTTMAEVTIPSTVKTIGKDAFSYCDNVKVFEIPSSVEKIDDYGFYATGSNTEKIVIHKDGAQDLVLGKDWIPNKKGTLGSKVDVQWAGA